MGGKLNKCEGDRDEIIVVIDKIKQLSIIKEKIFQVADLTETTTIYTSELKFLNQYQKCVDKKKGISQKILANLCGILTAECNLVLHEIAEFTMMFTMENNKARIYTVEGTGVKIPAAMASGYQKFVMDMILRIVLTTEISNSSGNISNPEILIIDEGFGCLDKKNFVEVAKILTKLKVKFKAIVVITHIEELKTYADELINITKHHGESKINYGRNAVGEYDANEALKMDLVTEINGKKATLEKSRVAINNKQTEKKAIISAKKSEKAKAKNVENDKKEAKQLALEAKKIAIKQKECELNTIMDSNALIKGRIITEYKDGDYSMFKCVVCDKAYISTATKINKHISSSSYRAKHKKYIKSLL